MAYLRWGTNPDDLYVWVGAGPYSRGSGACDLVHFWLSAEEEDQYTMPAGCLDGLVAKWRTRRPRMTSVSYRQTTAQMVTINGENRLRLHHRDWTRTIEMAEATWETLVTRAARRK
jgi:hypothetical protein